MNFITFAVLLLSLTVVPAYSKRGKAVTKLLCPRVSLPNGRIRYQKSGREVRFRCLATYKALGDVNAACVRGRWTAPPPVCVKRGCGPAADPANGAWQPSLGGAVASLVCDPGHALASAADSDIYCNGASWRPRRGPPQCRAIIETRKTTCDFETEDLCGWGQDMSLESIWIRNNYSTPSGYMQTGPSFDHTFGEGFGGHYMFVESSSPRKENDIARLYSPVYSQELAEDGCFMFWYNMYGINTGSLKVYIKPQTTSLKDLDASFLKSGNQGPRWIQAMVPLTSVNESFQVIIEAIRGNGFLGDSAIDDVALRKGSDCVIIPDQPITAAPITAAIRQDAETSTERASREQAVKTFPTFLPAPPLPDLPPMPPGPDAAFTAHTPVFSTATQSLLPLTLAAGPPIQNGTLTPQTNSTFVPQTTGHILVPYITTSHTLLYATFRSRPNLPYKSETTSNGTDHSDINITTHIAIGTTTRKPDITEAVTNISTTRLVELNSPSSTFNILSTLGATSQSIIRTSTIPITEPVLPTKTTQRPTRIPSTLRTPPTTPRTTKWSPTITSIPKTTLKPTMQKTKATSKQILNTTTITVPTLKTTTYKTKPTWRVKYFTVPKTVKPKYLPNTSKYRPVTTTSRKPSTTTNTPSQAPPTPTATKRSNYRVFQRVVKPVSAPANKTPRVSPAKTVIIVLVVTLTVLLIAVLAFFVVRKRLRLRRLRNVTEDSDVRYLTSDEILDFNMARPADD